MKTLLITFLALISFINVENQEDIKNITATFDGFENGIYTFSDTDNEIYYFNRIDASVNEKYDLTGLDFVGDKFNISYKIELEEVNDDESTIFHTIMNLKLER
jgi:hypothetical protein